MHEWLIAVKNKKKQKKAKKKLTAGRLFFESPTNNMSQPFNVSMRPKLTTPMIKQLATDLEDFLDMKERKDPRVKGFIAICCHQFTHELGAVDEKVMQALMNDHKEEAKKNIMTATAMPDIELNDQIHYPLMFRYTDKENAHDLLYFSIHLEEKPTKEQFCTILKESEGWYWLFRTKANRDAVVAWYAKMNAKAE
jgi:hypothetical protein